MEMNVTATWCKWAFVWTAKVAPNLGALREVPCADVTAPLLFNYRRHQLLHRLSRRPRRRYVDVFQLNAETNGPGPSIRRLPTDRAAPTTFSRTLTLNYARTVGGELLKTKSLHFTMFTWGPWWIWAVFLKICYLKMSFWRTLASIFRHNFHDMQKKNIQYDSKVSE